MSNIIPPLLSDSPPPPPPDIDDHEDDEFGDFTGTINLSYDCDDDSYSPLNLPKEPFEIDDPVLTEVYDINSNSKENGVILTEPPPLDKPKDFHDKRKCGDVISLNSGTNVLDNTVDNNLVEKNTCQNQSISEITSSSNLECLKNKDENLKEESLPLCNNTTSSLDDNSSTSSHNLEKTELTCVQKLNEILVTNCDMKTTSNQNETSDISSKNFEETSNETISLNNKIHEQVSTDTKCINIDSSLENISAQDLKKCVNFEGNISEDKSEIKGNIWESNSLENYAQQDEELDSINNAEDNFEELNAQNNSKIDQEGVKKGKSENSNDDGNNVSTDNIFKSDDDNFIASKEILSQTLLIKEDSTDVCNFSADSLQSSSEVSKNPITVSQGPPKFDELNDDFEDFSSAFDNTNSVLEARVSHKIVDNSMKDDCNDFSLVNNNICKSDKEESQTDSLEQDDFGDFTTSFPSVTEDATNKDLVQNTDESIKSLVVSLSSVSESSFKNVSKETSQEESHDDNFGNFTTVSQSHFETDFSKFADDDDFGDFTMSATNEKDDEFGDFALSKEESLPEQTNMNVQQEDFENFASFPSTSQNESNNHLFDDEFGDFTSTVNAPKVLLLNEKQALDKSQEILKEMFPMCGVNVSDFEERNSEKKDKIFNQIKNITETHALAFQWPKSSSQNLLLKALNIDYRNIMFGPGWNPSMPRFAANLSLTPLEPVKSENPTPTSANETNPSISGQSANVEVPQFDLNELQLMDPIDSLSSKDTTNATAKPTESFKGLGKDVPVFTSLKLQPSILQETSSSPSTAKSNLEDKVTLTIQQDDFDDYVSHSTSQDSNSHGHSIILRETHISSKELSKPDDNDIVSYLEPTIVTPELTRKDHTFVEPEDEFDDFQMVIPASQGQTIHETSNTLTVKPLKVLKPTGLVKSNSVPLSSALDLDFFEKSSPRDFKEVEEPKSKPTGTASIDDDFGDFTYSLPSQSVSLPQSDLPHVSSAPQLTPVTYVVRLAPTPVLEPLKPSVVHSQTSSSQISWPDPGITEDEIKRFEAFNYSRVQNNPILSENSSPKAVSVKNKDVFDRKSVVVPSVVPTSEIKSASNKPPPKATHQTKQSSLDDDEWSDFVSVQNPSPVHKLKAERERSSTPDLPLSVLNLGNIQPTKQPIPVITPNGLVQTKLSSNMSRNFSTIMQSNRSYPQLQQTAPVYQPSIISNQYASQAYGGFSSYGSSHHAYSSSSTSSKAQVPASADDDEWSDFVSHQPTVQKAAQPRHTQSWSGQSNQFSSWTGLTPNIITNPSASFDGFSGPTVQRQAKKLSNPVQSKKSGVPNVAMPDLDFLAPRSRTSNRK